MCLSFVYQQPCNSQFPQAFQVTQVHTQTPSSLLYTGCNTAVVETIACNNPICWGWPC